VFACEGCGQTFDHPGYCRADGQPLHPIDDPLIGSEVGRFRLARVLGRGGMGRVYLGVHATSGARVAIKVLSEDCAEHAQLVERFLVEARAVNLIQHGSIASVLDLQHLADGRPYIVMEYVEGPTLRQVTAGGVAPLGGVAQVIGEVLQALAAAHAAGVIHRDLKPDNVLVTTEGHAKVLDFGIAKLSASHGPLPRTQTGVILGTPEYMAPEQISEGLVDARTDLYAVGVMLYEAVTGQRPFDGANDFEIMRAHVDAPVPPPMLARSDLTPAFEAVILRALQKRPRDRFASAIEMADALARAAAALPADQQRELSARARALPPPVAPASQPPPEPHASGLDATLRERPSVRRPPAPVPVPVPALRPGSSLRNRWLLVCASAFVVAGAATVAIVFTGGSSGPPPPSPAARPAPTPAAAPGQDPDTTPTSFDVLAYLPTAEALARRQVADAELTGLVFDGVAADGRIDLDHGAVHLYAFRSLARSRRTRDLPPGQLDYRPCLIIVQVTSAYVTAQISDDLHCDQPLVRRPTCTAREVWQRARADGVAETRPARIAWGAERRWSFALDRSGNSASEARWLVDDCR